MKKLFVLPLAMFAAGASAQHTLHIPDTLSGTTFHLIVHPDSAQFQGGAFTQTFGVNGSHYLGPTLIMRKGDSIDMTVTNNMGDTTTMHWHGFHVAPTNDGGPHSMIMNGASWNPRFVVRNAAGTYWYHPHVMMKTAEQALKGDVGMIIVRDDNEAALAIPRTYGVDDFPVIVQTVELDSNNQVMPRGMVDSIILVNGTDTPVVSMPAQIVRLRLLNAAGERTFNFGFTDDKSFYVIGNDNGLLPAPVATTRIRLSPGERAEVLLDLGGMDGQTIFLKSDASELSSDIQGGPTMDMGGGPPMNSPLNGIDFNILQINVGGSTADPITSVPAALVPDTPYTESSASVTRTINMTADSFAVMDGPFYFNDSSFNMDRIDYHIPLNDIEIWTLNNQTMVAHPFHIHDVHFYILDRDGNPPGIAERGRKDVVLVESMETVRFIAKFDDFADTTVPYMYHCHILMHEDDGMMGQFVVTPGLSIATVPAGDYALLLYPNPAKSTFTVRLDEAMPHAKRTLIIYDAIGNVVYCAPMNGDAGQVQVTGWQTGFYHAVLTGSNDRYSKSFLVE